jgi:hypothetical protein
MSNIGRLRRHLKQVEQKGPVSKKKYRGRLKFIRNLQSDNARVYSLHYHYTKGYRTRWIGVQRPSRFVGTR